MRVSLRAGETLPMDLLPIDTVVMYSDGNAAFEQE